MAKKYKPLEKEQRKVIRNQQKIAKMNILKHGVQLNQVTYDLDNDVSLTNLKWNKETLEASIKMEQHNIREAEKLLIRGFEVKEQQASDKVSEQFDEKEKKDDLKQKKLNEEKKGKIISPGDVEKEEPKTEADGDGT